MKKTLNISFVLLTLSILLFSLSFGASAETEGIFTYTVADDKATVTYVDPSTTGDVIIPETLGGYEVTTLTSNSFNACESIGEFFIPATVTDIKNDAIDYMWCEKIIVDENNPNYSSDEYGVLFNKNKTQIIRYPARSTLESYDIPDTVNEFISRPFQHCQFGLTHVSIPEGVTTLPNCAFFGATTITSIDFPDTLTTIGPNCFAWCHSLNDPEIPHSVTSIQSSAFTECNALRTFRFPEGINTVSYYVLSDCPMLERVYIPASVTTIENNAFSNSSSLTDIYFGGTPQQWEAITDKTTEKESNSYFLNARIHYEYDPSLYRGIDTYTVNNIVNIVGSGEIKQGNGNWHYWNEYADEAQVIIIEGDFSAFNPGAFTSFPNVTTVLINSPSLQIKQGAFNNCPLIETVISFSDEQFSDTAFTDCGTSIQIFSAGAESYTQKDGIKTIPFAFNEGSITFFGDVEVDSYTFFDIATAMGLMYSDIKSMKFNKFTCEDITFYRYDEANYSYVPVDGNTLENADFSVFIDSYETGRVDITFNQLCDGISDGTITDFYLVAANEQGDDVLDTEIEVKDEEDQQQDNFFVRALKWIVSLLNKLFKLLSKLR